MTNRLGLSLALAVALLSVPGAFAQKAGAQEPKALKKKITKVVRCDYLLYLPADYGRDSSTRWPVLLFLHGSGERGSDLQKVKVHGPPKLIGQGKEMPFIVVSPQCPENESWSSEVLGTLLDEVEKKYRVDKDREYVTGLSMGGFGTWDLTMAFPTRFAAIAPICGGGTPRRAGRIRNVPAWIFHGGKDPTVPVKESQDMYDALKAAGDPDVKLTIYPDPQHDSWTETYNNPELYTWLLSHSRAERK
ncbi:MAG TPA: prolyl oligopeptidase family serine peptidase [Armatimonadota bacterium]|jgi:predicted peptidase